MEKTRTDIIKIAVTLIMMNLMLGFINEGFNHTISEDNTLIEQALQKQMDKISVMENQVDQSGIIMEGVTSETQCSEFQGKWDSDADVCRSAITSNGNSDFTVFNPFFYIFGFIDILTKIVKLIGVVMFFELYLLFKLTPMINHFILAGFVSTILIAFQCYILYYVWAFVSDYRGQQQGRQ